jgi:hypothetical protein
VLERALAAYRGEASDDCDLDARVAYAERVGDEVDRYR